MIVRLATLALLVACHGADGGDMSAIGRGQQLVTVGGCGECHTPRKLDPARHMPVPDPTPDNETGLGTWSEAEFIATMRNGHRKGKERVMLPPMPWQNLAAMSDEDLRAVYAYLRSIPPIKNRVPEPKVSAQAIAAFERRL